MGFLKIKIKEFKKKYFLTIKFYRLPLTLLTDQQ